MIINFIKTVVDIFRNKEAILNEKYDFGKIGDYGLRFFIF